MSRLNWYGKKCSAEIRGEYVKRMTQACITLVNHIKESISLPSNKGETPSQPGEPPHKYLGRLRAGISYEVDKKEMRARVGTNVLYGKFLELGTKKMAPRPFLKAAVEKMRAVVARILGGG